jgi:DNA polymerase V
MSTKTNGKTEQKCTGFVSPAQGYEDQTIDLNKLIIQNPPATFFFRLESNEMIDLHLPRGSLLIIDRSVNPDNNSIVLISHEGSFMCRQILIDDDNIMFTNGKDTFLPIPDDTEIIGTLRASVQFYDNAY